MTSATMVVASKVVEAEAVFDIAVPLAMVVPIHAVANNMASPEEWAAVEAWAEKVGLDAAAQALAAIATQLDPKDTTSPQEWAFMLNAKKQGLLRAE